MSARRRWTKNRARYSRWRRFGVAGQVRRQVRQGRVEQAQQRPERRFVARVRRGGDEDQVPAGSAERSRSSR